MSKSTKRQRVKDETHFLRHLTEDISWDDHNIFENNQSLSFINENKSDVEFTQLLDPIKNESNRQSSNLLE